MRVEDWREDVYGLLLELSVVHLESWSISVKTFIEFYAWIWIDE